MKKGPYVEGILGIMFLLTSLIMGYKYVGGYFVNFIDYPSLILLCFLLLISLYAGNQLRYFAQAIKNAFIKSSKEISKSDIKRMEYSIDYAIKVLMFGGMFFAVIYLFTLFQNLPASADYEIVLINVAIAFLSVFWSLFFSLFLVQIKGRIHNLSNHLGDGETL